MGKAISYFLAFGAIFLLIERSPACMVVDFSTVICGAVTMSVQWSMAYAWVGARRFYFLVCLFAVGVFVIRANLCA